MESQSKILNSGIILKTFIHEVPTEVHAILMPHIKFLLNLTYSLGDVV